ncbi:hypothetical protein GOA61_20880 [Sinorhizobium meliloti]|nr:hypothetical protein [Sinorhizobium meliloti]MDW9879450.1 hypothetical protein [Sinorhizobium meliloti]
MLSDVAMVGFASLIVVTENTFAFHHEGEPILVQVSAARNRRGNLPNDDFKERLFA